MHNVHTDNLLALRTIKNKHEFKKIYIYYTEDGVLDEKEFDFAPWTKVDDTELGN